MSKKLHLNPKIYPIHKFLFFAALIVSISPAYTQDTDNDDEEVFELSPFTVDASEDMGYYASQTLAGGRLSTDIINTGSSIEVVTADFMDDIGANDIQELLQYTTNTEIGGNLGNFTGASVDTSQGNVDEQSAMRNPDANSRIRGLARPDSTRNFFKTQIPFDQYNTERVDINRGSNSFLFGLGSPAGLINNQLAQARFNDSTKLRFRIASGGDRPSFRTELDINREIIKDRLAVRVSGMVNRTQYRQQPTFRDDNRIYGTVTWHPFDNKKQTTIRAYYESGDIYSSPVSTTLPTQAVDTWLRYRVPINVDLNTRLYRQQYGFASGDVNANPDRFDIITAIDALRDEDGVYGWWPVYDYASNGKVDGDYSRPGNDVMTNIGGAGYTLVYDGTSNDVAYIMQPQVNGQTSNFLRGKGSWKKVKIDGENVWTRKVTEAGDAWWSPTGSTSGSSQMRFYGNSRNYEERGVGWYKQGFTDLETFDFSKYSLSNGNDFWERDFYNYNITLEQLFLDGKAGVEVAFDYQYSQHNTMTYFSAGGAEVKIDINMTIPTMPQIDADGNVIYPEYDPVTNLPVVDENGYVVGGAMPNPNYGRPFINSRRSDGHNRYDDTTIRATAFYKLDFDDYSGDDGWLRWLGQHTFSLLGDSWIEEYEGIGTTLRAFSDDFYVGQNIADNSGTSAVAGARQVGRIAYIGPAVQSYLGDEVWDPTNPISMSQIILEPANYNMSLASQEGWSQNFWYWDRGDADPSITNPVMGTDDWINGDEGWAYGSLDPVMTANEAVQIRRTEVNSWAVNAQSFFFNRHLVINTGYREDFIDSWLNREAPKSEFDQIPDVSPEAFSPYDGDLETIDKGPDGSGTFGYGAVLHWPKNIIKIPESMDISFHYNFSENFIPDTSRRSISEDIELIRLSSPQGESLDYGVTFQLFDRKLIVRLNWYENILIGADSSVGNIFNQNLNKMFTYFGNNYQDIVRLDSSDGTIYGEFDGVISNYDEIETARDTQFDDNGDPIITGYETDEFGEIIIDPDTGEGTPIYLMETNQMVIDREWPNWEETNQAVAEIFEILQSGYWQLKEERNRIRLFDDGQIEQENISAITDVEDLKATGFEASITWNPTRSWRMRLNVARQETVSSNLSPHLTRFIQEDYLPWVLKWGHLDWNESVAPNSGATLEENVNENLLEYYTVKSLEGFPSDEVREWRVNMVTNYSFRDGPLKGFSVGGSARWQSAAAIGYPLIEKEILPDTYILVGDVDNPYMGDDELSFDLQCGYSKKFRKVNWQIQLNVKNLQNINSDELSVLIAQPDGSAAKVKWNPPFTWQITNTFRW